MMMKSVFWWRKPEYPEETTDLWRGGDYDDDEMSVSLAEETGTPRGNHRPTARGGGGGYSPRKRRLSPLNYRGPPELRRYCFSYIIQGTETSFLLHHQYFTKLVNSGLTGGSLSWITVTTSGSLGEFIAT